MTIGARPTVEPSAREAQYEVEIERDCAIACLDGVELAGDLYRPVDAPPSPALVTLLPYNKDGVGGITAWEANHFFAARGYPSLLVDFRGTGASGGIPRPPFDPAEADDGLAIIEWMAQHPCCDGRVGMWGVSYGAITALRTATRQPDALRAILPVMGFLDPERDFVHPSGRRGCAASLGTWGLITLAQYLTPPLRPDADGDWQRRWRERLEHGEPYLVDLLQTSPGDPRWRSRAIDAATIAVPTFCVAGWRDLNCDATIRAYEQIQSPKQLLVGPWMHTMPNESAFAPVDFLALALEWWDRWLADDPPTETSFPATIYLQGRQQWCQLPHWPPQDAEAISRTASADGELVAEAPKAGELTSPVDATVGTHAGLSGMPTRGFGLPRDQHADDARSIAFTSAPLDEPLLICGRPRVTLSLPDTDDPAPTYVVKLAHVAPNGRSALITTGTATAPDPGTNTARLRLELTATAYEIPAGDRLRLVIAAGDFPRLWPQTSAQGLAIRSGPDQTTIELPTLPPDQAVTDLPTPPAPSLPPLVLRADPLYTVTHNAMTDAVTVTVGDHFLGTIPAKDGTLDINAYVAATVTADSPEGAHLSGKSTTHATTSRGEFRTRAEILISADAAVLTGEVTFEGQSLFSRRWTL